MAARRYPTSTNPDTVRPWRIINATTNEKLSHRCYAILDNARLGAFIECKKAKVGTVLEVYNCVRGTEHGQYKRGLNDISFPNPKGY